MALRAGVLAAALASLAACGGPQSALTPGGRSAAEIHDLSMILFVGGTVTFAAVMALALYAVLAAPGRFPGARGWVLGGGIAFPVIALTALQVYEFGIARRLAAIGGPDALRIEVTAHMWWWDVRYPGAGAPGTGGLRTANEIVIPAGRPVELVVSAADVIHSIWIPSLAGKIDMIPGHVNRLGILAERPGVYRGQCAEYCGAQHALMAFDVVVEPPDRFEAWLAARNRHLPEPADPRLAAGRDAFLRLGCGACHRVYGVASGMLGPDLTHMGARGTIGAGALANGPEALAGWIADAQHAKPGNAMPSYGPVGAEALDAISAWLWSLK
ncbi:cytochrome c oxidase subunit II [Arenibaculum pallidiluteum]|uniref:cytochrome c oxidase subunit II n=1 Tax=Arenibaculum pallidiluteum TaxID=2812559 RepID=UPI001A95F509|nr:c-type cytochrome [Arenibaculum pallidiluteum]